MGTVHIPKVMRDNVLMYYGDRGLDWIDRLPAVISEVARQWSLQVLEPYPNPSINFVAPVIKRDGSEAVLKLGVPGREISAEIAALSRFGGEGAVILLESDPALGMLLLEKLTPGTPLFEDSDTPLAVEIAGGGYESLVESTSGRTQFSDGGRVVLRARQSAKPVRRRNRPLPLTNL